MNKKIQIFIILVFTLLAYANIFRNTFVIDDQYYKSGPLGVGSVGQLLLCANLNHNPVYRQSVASYIHCIIRHGGPIHWYHHSLAVHLISTMLVYLICRSCPRLLLLGLLFGLHPIHAKSITYIAQYEANSLFLASCTYLLNKSFYR